MLNKLAGTVRLNQQLFCIICLRKIRPVFTMLKVFLCQLVDKRQPASNSRRRFSFSARNSASVFFFVWPLIGKRMAAVCGVCGVCGGEEKIEHGMGGGGFIVSDADDARAEIKRDRTTSAWIAYLLTTSSLRCSTKQFSIAPHSLQRPAIKVDSMHLLVQRSIQKCRQKA